MVAGELLHLQMIFRGASAGTDWPAIEDVNAFLPNSAWQEYRSRLADTVDEDLWDQLVMAYALLEADRARFVTAAKLAPDRPLAAPRTTWDACADGSVTEGRVAG